MTLKELMKKASPLPLKACAEPYADQVISIPLYEEAKRKGFGDGTCCGESLVFETAGNKDNVLLYVHCVNNFAQVVEALEKATALLAQTPLGKYPDESALRDEIESILAAAQTIPSGGKEGVDICSVCDGVFTYGTLDDITEAGFELICPACKAKASPSGEKGTEL